MTRNLGGPGDSCSTTRPLQGSGRLVMGRDDPSLAVPGMTFGVVDKHLTNINKGQ